MLVDDAMPVDVKKGAGHVESRNWTDARDAPGVQRIRQGVDDDGSQNGLGARCGGQGAPGDRESRHLSLLQNLLERCVQRSAGNDCC